MEYVWEHNNIRLHYREKGEGDVLLFLPGAIRATIYEKTLFELAKQYRVVIPDLPGFGKSTVPPSSWGFAEYASFIKKFMDFLAVSSYVVVGHSFGGGIALALAKNEHKLKKMFVYGAMGVASKKSIPRFYFDMFVRKTLHNVFYHNGFELKRIMLNNGISTLLENADEIIPIIKIANRCIYSTISSLAQIRVPTYIIYGTRDELFTIDSAEYMQQQISGSSLLIQDTIHDWCIHEPVRFGKLVKKCLL